MIIQWVLYVYLCLFHVISAAKEGVFVCFMRLKEFKHNFFPQSHNCYLINTQYMRLKQVISCSQQPFNSLYFLKR